MNIRILFPNRTQIFTAAFFLFLGGANFLRADTNLYVAQDGSAPFHSVQAAIMSVPMGFSTNRVLIHIKPGTYKERIYVQREKRFFHLIGEDPEKTVLTFDLSANLPAPGGGKLGTFRTPSTTIDAEDFTAENVTFENSAGAVGQALAIAVNGDRCVFRNCRFLGWQDTMFLNRGRQYFENCYIAGHVDFIFGGATAFFENCRIHCLKNGYITAASTPETQAFGFVFDHCQITGEPGVKTFLGRPWRIYASTIFMNTKMSDVVRPEGWNNWRKPEAEKTARYAEFNNSGPGANPKSRAPWIKQLTKRQAAKITVSNVLGGTDHWNPLAKSRRSIFSKIFGRNKE
ncbi:MAG TPA: pectinesterase family protein [Verrucomicrobiae bacterium]|nr:pectinesterase family protein [Verrucomicrobiae bacterium]